MKMKSYLVAGIACYALATNVSAEPVTVIGWLEHVQLQPQNIMLKAKIDTGADNSSIHADNIEIYEQNNIKMVRFSVVNKEGETANFDLPLQRFAQIKRKKAEPLQRPVVNIGLCVGNKLKQIPVNLANRSNFKYRMLIGRSFLKDNYLVNSSKQYTAEPTCKTKSLAYNQAYSISTIMN